MRRASLALAALAAVLALAPGRAAATPAPDSGTGGAPADVELPAAADPLTGTAMWIYHVAASGGGTPASIGARARTAAITTVIVKAADGPAAWPQFSRALVEGLHAEGLQVCAYQRLFGRRPAAEAATALRAVAQGADCFVIDGEAELEGRYAAARTYTRALRRGVGADYPVAFTSFPYASLHPDLPYSVFLGPGGAQVHLPQIYWKAIGDPIATAWARTYRDLSIYPQPIRPVGQLYGSPTLAELARFEQLAQAYGAEGHSWWVWEHASAAQLRAIGLPPPAPLALGHPATKGFAHPQLRRGARGDAVLQARALLRAAGGPATGGARFDAGLARTLTAFQREAGLPVTARLDDPTWDALLAGGCQAAAACTASRMTSRSAPFSR